jgi:hypothetical protein
MQVNMIAAGSVNEFSHLDLDVIKTAVTERGSPTPLDVKVKAKQAGDHVELSITCLLETASVDFKGAWDSWLFASIFLSEALGGPYPHNGKTVKILANPSVELGQLQTSSAPRSNGALGLVVAATAMTILSIFA